MEKGYGIMCADVRNPVRSAGIGKKEQTKKIRNEGFGGNDDDKASA